MPISVSSVVEGMTSTVSNFYAASKEGISLAGDSVEKRGLILPKPDVPSVLTPLALVPTHTLHGSERSSSPLLMAKNSSHLQNENKLREV